MRLWGLSLAAALAASALLAGGQAPLAPVATLEVLDSVAQADSAALTVDTLAPTDSIAAIDSLPARRQRRKRSMTPVSTAAAVTQTVNEGLTDTVRINAERRATWAHYHDDQGRVVYVDTISGQEWMDTLAYGGPSGLPRMKYDLWHSASIGVNIWDPIMRVFGQHYGLADAFVQVSLHNRYKPTFEMGLGLAQNTPADGNFTYRSPLSVFFKIGADYNFLYNSSPDYQFTAGVRYGFAPFSFSVDNVTVDSPYWDETARFDIPAQHVTAGWLELGLGLRVMIWGPWSAGWTLRYHTILHESKATHGNPWYIPGYGSRGSSLSGSISLVYTLSLNKWNRPAVNNVTDLPSGDMPAEAAE